MERKLSEMEEELKVTKSKSMLMAIREYFARVFKPVSPNNQSLDTREHTCACACVCLEHPVCVHSAIPPSKTPILFLPHLIQSPGNRSQIHINRTSPIPAQHKRNHTIFHVCVWGGRDLHLFCYRSCMFLASVYTVFLLYFRSPPKSCVCVCARECVKITYSFSYV